MKKSLFFPVILAILICSANAFALTQGTFRDVDKDTGTSWTQIIDELPTGDHSITITHAVLKLKFDFTPEKLGKHNFGESFTLVIDGKKAGTYNYSSTNGKKQNNVTWSITLSPRILKELSDRTANVVLVSKLGTITDVNRSLVKGRYNVAPEPISMALVGMGLIGLPFARRFRKSLS